MRLSDIRARKAINFIILNHWRSLLTICYHWLFIGSTPPASTSFRFERQRRREGCHAEAGWRRRAFQINHLSIEATARHAFLIAEMKFYYTYILQSEKAPNRYYIGFTEELESRLNAHDSWQVPLTSKHRPLHIKTAIAFTDPHKALDFEGYLKSAYLNRGKYLSTCE